jgi:hypothetical protein
MSDMILRPVENPSYRHFLDGMEAAAQICGSLAETTYDDSDSFEAATGCEAAIMGVVREQRAIAGSTANNLWLHLVSNASMKPEALEGIDAEAARTLLIGIARDAQAITGLTDQQAANIIAKAAGQ